MNAIIMARDPHAGLQQRTTIAACRFSRPTPARWRAAWRRSSDDPAALVEGFFERTEQIELAPRGETAAHRVWREEGFSIRLASRDETWMVSRDGIDGTEFLEALRKTARRMAQGLRPPPRLRAAPAPELPTLERRAPSGPRSRAQLRRRHLALPSAPRGAPPPPLDPDRGPRAGGRARERGLLEPARRPRRRFVGRAAARARRRRGGGRGGSLAALFRSRDAPAPAARRGELLLGASAAAVLLHEAVAHALEVDTLALTGDPAAAVGHRVGSEALDVLDDPSGGPPGLRRATDDEGVPVLRRWLLRRGIVEQPLADRHWARALAGAPAPAPAGASRGTGPRRRARSISSSCPAADAIADLAATVDDGLYAAEAARGFLDPLSGLFELHFPYGRRLRRGQLDERVGAFRLRGAVGDLLARIASAGREVTLAGAGWCAKGGQRLPVWSTTPGLLLHGVEVSG